MKRLKKIGRVLLQLAVVVGVFLTFGFIRAEKAKEQVQELDLRVDHSAGSYFIDKVVVADQLRRTGWGELVGMRLDSLDLHAIETSIQRNPFVASAQAYIDMQGRLSIEVSQREPVLRVVNQYMESFYLDQDARVMPTSKQYSAAVLVASGQINDRPAPGASVYSERLQQLFELNQFIRNDDLLNALFVQIYVNGKGEFELIPRVGNHTVLLGDLSMLEEKMEKLLALYQTSFSETEWKEYRLINLKFKDQVICKR